jgi:hypothetical protein
VGERRIHAQTHDGVQSRPPASEDSITRSGTYRLRLSVPGRLAVFGCSWSVTSVRLNFSAGLPPDVVAGENGMREAEFGRAGVIEPAQLGRGQADLEGTETVF